MTENLAFQVPHPFEQLAVRGSTAGPQLRSSLPVQHSREQHQLPAERRQPISEPQQYRPGQPRRQRYSHENISPLVYAEGHVR